MACQRSEEEERRRGWEKEIDDSRMVVLFRIDGVDAEQRQSFLEQLGITRVANRLCLLEQNVASELLWRVLGSQHPRIGS